MKLICANFKMNLLKNDIVNYLKVIEEKIPKENVIFFPNNIHIEYFKNKNYLVGSQDISFKDFGSITGDTSVLQLKELGITHTIIGHSERRGYFNDDNYIDKKVNLSLNNNIKAILCIGENLEEKNSNKTLEVLKNELDSGIKNNLSYINNNNLIIAYEPIWSIGTNVIPTNLELENTIKEIKNYLKETYNLNLKVLYGGSVNKQNINILDSVNNIDGYLIGSASLKPYDLLEIIKKM